MGIRTRYEDAVIMLSLRRYESALKDALLALAATSRRRRPDEKKVKDREAFESLVREDVYPALGGGEWTYTGPQGKLPLSTVLYKLARNPIVHESDFHDLVSCTYGDSLIEVCGNTGSIMLTDKFVQLLLNVVRHAPENRNSFPKNMYEAIPKPPYLKRLVIVEFQWGRERYRHVSSQASVVSAPWGANAEDRWWLRCNGYQQFNRSDVATHRKPIAALIPVEYLTHLEVGPEFQITRDREAGVVGVFPPDHDVPADGMSLESVDAFIAELQVEQPPGWDVRVIYPELSEWDRERITCWSPKVDTCLTNQVPKSAQIST